MTNKNFTYDVEDNCITFTVPNMWGGDLMEEWYIWGNTDEFYDLQHKLIGEWVQKHFGHIYSDENKMLAKLSGFNIDLIDYDWNEHPDWTMTVEIEVEPLNTDINDEPIYLEECPDMIKAIVDGLEIDDEPSYDFQEGQYEWFYENGVSGEDEFFVEKTIDIGKRILVQNPKYTFEAIDIWKDIKDATQDEMDAFINYYNYYTDCKDVYQSTKEAVEKAGFKFNLQPTYTEKTA